MGMDTGTDMGTDMDTDTEASPSKTTTPCSGAESFPVTLPRGTFDEVPGAFLSLPGSLWITEIHIDKSEQESYNCSID